MNETKNAKFNGSFEIVKVYLNNRFFDYKNE